MNFFKKLFGEAVDIEQLIAQKATIIDVRTVQEYSSGHIQQSINIPLNTIEANLDQIKKYNQPIITCCASGIRSGQAASILKSKGIEVHNGGSWKSIEKFV